MHTLFINGKFTAQRMTGVQRVAHNLLRALDERLFVGDSHLPGRVILLLPPGAPAPPLRSIETQHVGKRSVRLLLWEQCLLPLAARDGVLLNLAGASPLMTSRPVCLIHDAAVFDQPHAYSAAFGYWYRAMFRLLRWRGAMLLTVSAFSRQRLASRLGIEASRIGIVPGGGEHLSSVAPDISVLASYGLEAGRYLLAVGSANPNKNFAALRAAFSQLPKARDIKLAIVGGGDTRVFAGKHPRGLDAAAGIVCTGPLDDAHLKALYQHAVGLVFPSLYEGFGLPPLEAMSCGCPVAASSAAAVPEICGNAALYFDPMSVQQISTAMQSLLDDQALRQNLRVAGAERLTHFGWDHAAQRLLVYLLAALAAPDSKP